MDPLLALVCRCFRENVIGTYKIASFLCSLDNFLLKNVFVFSFENQILKWRSFEKKKGYFDLLFTVFSHQGKDTKNLSAHVSLRNIHVFCSPYCFLFLFCFVLFCFVLFVCLFFCLTYFATITNLSHIVSLWCDSWRWFLFLPLSGKFKVGMSTTKIYLH